MKKPTFPCVVCSSVFMESVIRESVGVYIAQNETDLIKICERYVLENYGYTFFDFDSFDEKNGIYRIHFVAGFSNENYGTFCYHVIPLIHA